MKSFTDVNVFYCYLVNYVGIAIFFIKLNFGTLVVDFLNKKSSKNIVFKGQG